MFRSWNEFGGSAIARGYSPMYGLSRFDKINRSLRRAVGQRFYKQAVAPSPTQRKKKSRGEGMSSPLIEFTGAAHEHVEPNFDKSLTIGTNVQNFGPFEVSAYGYIRSLFLLVQVSGLTAGTATEDAPFNVLANVGLVDVNGGWIQHPVSGYDLFLENLYGNAAAFQQDPRLQPDYVGTTPNFVFGLRIPVEIHANDGLGALGNQNAATTYRVEVDLNTIANVWSVAPTGTGTVRLRGYLEAWTQPRAQSLDGRLQAITPPAHGSTQEWSKQVVAYNSGDNTIRLVRMGNLIKNIIFVNRDTTPVRSTANFPDPIEIRWDSKQLLKEPRYLRRTYMNERFIHSAAGLPAGVFVYDFDHDVSGHGGNGTPELWLPTMQSTRFEIVGNFGGAGNLTILTNDVLPVEEDPTQRFDFESETGFSPSV